MSMQISPRCGEGHHLACPRWWWTIKDKIALTCFCWCHEHKTFVGNNGPH